MDPLGRYHLVPRARGQGRRDQPRALGHRAVIAAQRRDIDRGAQRVDLLARHARSDVAPVEAHRLIPSPFLEHLRPVVHEPAHRGVLNARQVPHEPGDGVHAARPLPHLLVAQSAEEIVDESAVHGVVAQIDQVQRVHRATLFRLSSSRDRGPGGGARRARRCRERPRRGRRRCERRASSGRAGSGRRWTSRPRPRT